MILAKKKKEKKGIARQTTVTEKACYEHITKKEL